MRILLAIDNSKDSQAAIEYVARMGFAEPVDLHLVMVISPSYLVDSQFGGLPLEITALLEEDRKHAREKLTKVTSDLVGRFQSVTSTVEFGTPGREIRELAAKKQSDLVVLGATGHSTIQRVLLGSVSNYVATHAEQSTLIVRPANQEAAKTTDQSVKTQVLVALQNSDKDSDLIRWLRQIAQPADTNVHLVHVMQMMTFYRQDLRQRASETWQASRSAAQSRADELEQTLLDAGYSATSEILEADHVGEALVQYSDEMNCELVIAGDRDQNLIDRVFLGSTSRYLLHHSNASVLIRRDAASQM